MRRLAPPLALLTAALAVSATAAPPKPERFTDDGFTPLFDGTSLNGWTVSAKSGHSAASKHRSGGKWVVQDGAIVGSQDTPGNGGLLLTDKLFTDFEVALEMRNDFGPDSGLFLRSDDRGRAYQAMIDYHPGGNLMGVYGEGIGGFRSRNFSFGGKVTEIKEENEGGAIPLAVRPADWPAFWDAAKWNELRARVTGQPARIRTWINGVPISDWKDQRSTGNRPAKGSVGLQVHGGGDHTRAFVRYRNVRVKELK